MVRNNFAFILLSGAVSVGPALAQEAFKSEASVQFLGTFVSTTTSQGVQQTATDSGGVLASYRYFFNGFNGVEVNYGFATGTQKYLYLPGAFSNSVRTNSDEATAAWVFRYPKRRVVPFGLVGTGALIFVPQSAPPTTQARAAFVYGGGVDVGFTHRLFLRAQYRGFVYSSPDFNTFYLGPDRVTHRAEPSIGFGIRL